MVVGFVGTVASGRWPARRGAAEPPNAPAIGMEARRAETQVAEARYAVGQPGPKGSPIKRNGGGWVVDCGWGMGMRQGEDEDVQPAGFGGRGRLDRQACRPGTIAVRGRVHGPGDCGPVR